MDYFNISATDFFSKTRKREIVQARQTAIYLSRRERDENKEKHRIGEIAYNDLSWDWSLSYIGKKTGNKDHATVLHSIKTVNNLLYSDKSFKQDVDEIIKKIYGTEPLSEKDKLRKRITMLLYIVNKQKDEIKRLNNKQREIHELLEQN